MKVILVFTKFVLVCMKSNLKLTLDVRELQMKSKKKVIDVLNRKSCNRHNKKTVHWGAQTFCFVVWDAHIFLA